MASKNLVAKLDRIFSEYIRLRDRNNNGYFTCISCGRPLTVDQMDAGHFINRRWMQLRWREDNVHGQCRSCNRFDEGNIPAYTRFMERKYGPDHVDFLISLKTAYRYSDEEINLLIKEYQAKVKQLKNMLK